MHNHRLELSNLCSDPGEQEARLALANQFAAEMHKNFRVLDRDRNDVLSAAELVMGMDNEKLSPKLRDACRYFDLTDTRTQWVKSDFDNIRIATSNDPTEKKNLLDCHQASAIAVGSVLGIGAAGIGMLAISRNTNLASRIVGSALIGAAVGGGTYGGLGYLLHENWQHERKFYGRNTYADEVVQPYLKKK